MRYCVILVFLLLCPSVDAAILHVPGDYYSIQTGIDAAVAGDTVLVAPGTYYEKIDFLGKAITVMSEQGPELTLIDGSDPVDVNYGSVVTFENGESPESILKGFAITNGPGTEIVSAQFSYIFGGGIFCQGSSPTITGNHIINNKLEDTYEADGYNGGGIACLNEACPLIEGNLFEENQANSGGAIYCTSKAAPAVRHNVINYNYVKDYHTPTGPLSASGGAAIAAFGMVSVTDAHLYIEDNVIHHNIADKGAGGIRLHVRSKGVVRRNDIRFNRGNAITGFVIRSLTVEDNIITDAQNGHGIYCWNAWPGIKIFNNRIARCQRSGIWVEESSVQITGNIIHDNTHTHGAGIFIDGGGKIRNNIIAFNTATDLENGGGGIYLTNSTHSKIVNCTLFGNSSAVRGGAITSPKAHPTLVNSIVWDNSATSGLELYGENLIVEHSNIMGGYSGTGNIEADPLFADAAGHDFHITFISPCRGAGDNSVEWLTDLDFEGDPRIAQGSVDIGADEFYTHLYYMGDAIPNQGIYTNLVGIPNQEALLYIGTGIVETPTHTQYGDWYLIPPLTTLCLGEIPWSGIITLYSRIPPDCPTPMSIPLQGLSRGKLTNPCVIEVR